MSIDLSLNQDEEILKSTALSFLDREITKEALQAMHDSDTGTTDEIWDKIKEMGWLGIVIPEEFGGVGYPLTSAGVLFEMLGSAPLPGPLFSSGVLGAMVIMESASNDQKQEILPQAAEGKIVLAAALTEPDFGWDFANITASAKKQNGQYVLNGVKLFVQDAMASTHLLVAAKTEGPGFSLFLVDKKTDGVSMRRLPGYLAGRFFEVKFENVKLEASSLLGEEGAGKSSLNRAFIKAIPILSAYKAGGCQGVYNMAVEYSRVRVQFSQPIGRFQRVQDMIIEMVNQADAARLTSYEALWKLDNGLDAEESAHLAKAVASEAYFQVCTLGHRTFSGISYSMEHPLALHTRTSRHLYNFLGEPSHHRQRLAELILE